jgi:phosphatidylglycerophosphate synthase
MQQSEPAPSLVPVGSNPTLIWGMTAQERLRRIAAAQSLPFDAPAGPAILANLDYVFDPAWLPHLRRNPDHVVVLGGQVVLAYAASEQMREQARAAILQGRVPAGFTVIDAADEAGIFNEALRKRERPFAQRLIPENVRAIERASYVGAYKGVTDLLTKYLWPEWAFVLTRIAARLGISPNQVTAIGSVLCIVATIAFWHGWFWTGLATGLIFMVLDTVDGKLARCTITSSALGNAWDHGVDLVHPPFWWWAWAAGCAAYGRPLSDSMFWIVFATIMVGYVVQRLIEGAFIVRFGMHIHVWQRFDSQFRLVTARRNPNMVILFAALVISRPDWGIEAVAVWTALSCLVHLVRLVQAMAAKARGETIRSWLA